MGNKLFSFLFFEVSVKKKLSSRASVKDEKK